jgi:hypothetical protein
MARYVLIAALLALAAALGGCLRVEFDRCDDDEPHPDCALLDGATDAGADAAAPDGSAPDGGT